jgi:hypothetical protein
MCAMKTLFCSSVSWNMNDIFIENWGKYIIVFYVKYVLSMMIELNLILISDDR